MADYQISTADEPTMFAAAQALGFIPAGTAYAPGVVGQLQGGSDASGHAWAVNIYGAQNLPAGATTTDPTTGAQVPAMQTNPGFFGILRVPDGYTLPGDTQTLASRALPYVYGAVTIAPIPAGSMTFSPVD